MTDDSYMKRPEITRTNEYLAKDQRKMLDFQRRKLKYSEENIRKDFNAFLGSKFYENIQRVFNQCWTICSEPEIQSDSISLTTSYDKFFKNKKKFPDTSCLNNCVSKKEESYQMLVQYLFAKLSANADKREDFQDLYEIPEKFRGNAI